MKVLHVLYSGLGGHSNVFFSMVKADEQKLFAYEALFNGIENVRDENRERCEKEGIKWYYEKKSPGKHFSFIKKLAAAIKLAQPDVVFLHASVNIPAAYLAKLTSRKKFKIVVRETQANHLKTKMEWLAIRVALLLANKVVFLSEAYKEEIKAKLPLWYKKKRVAVVPNGLNLQQFKPGIKTTADYFILGMQSRLVAIKDHSTLLQAMQLIQQQHPELKIKLKIAGEGNYESVLHGMVKDLNLHNTVEFTGLLPESELPSFLQSCDVYIHASLGETMSTAIMQAMACRLPVIASDVEGINNMVTNNVTGMLVKPKQPQQLANSIVALLNDETLRKTLAQNAYDYAQAAFSNKKMFEAYKTIFTE